MTGPWDYIDQCAWCGWNPDYCECPLVADDEIGLAYLCHGCRHHYILNDEPGTICTDHDPSDNCDDCEDCEEFSDSVKNPQASGEVEQSHSA